MGYRLKLTPERRTFLSRELSRLIDQALRDRTSLEQEWRANDDMYNGRVISSLTDFPWPGASAFNVPLMPTYTNAVTGRLVDSIHAPEPIFTARNVQRSSEWKEIADVVQDWLEYRMREVIKLRSVSEKAIFGLAKHGTTFIHMPYQVLLDKQLKYNPDSEKIEQTVGVRKAGPIALVPAIDDVLVPKEAVSIQMAPWRAIRYRLTEDDLLVRKFSAKYDEDSVKTVLAHMNGQVDAATRSRQEAQGFSTSEPEGFAEIWEFWGLLKLPDQEYASEFIIPYHLATNTPMSLLVNYYPNQMVPMFSANFQQTDMGLYGFGVGKMCVSGNDEVNKLHKHRVDNAMVCNTRAFKMRTSAYNQLPRKFRIFPGRFIPVTDMNDLDAIQIADIYPSTMNEEMLTRRTMEQYVGLVDFSLTGGGGEALKRVGATPALLAQQESGRVLNYRMNHVRTMYAEIACWNLEMDIHFRPVDEMMQVLGPKGVIAMKKLMDAPPEAVRGHMLIELTASSSNVNREIEKQSDIMLSNIMAQYIKGYVELAQVTKAVQDPDLKRVYMSGLKLMNSLISDITRDFNKRNDALVMAELTDATTAGAGGVEGQPPLAPGVGGAAGGAPPRPSQPPPGVQG